MNLFKMRLGIGSKKIDFDSTVTGAIFDLTTAAEWLKDEYTSLAWRTIDWVSTEPIIAMWSLKNGSVVEFDEEFQVLRFYQYHQPAPLLTASIKKDTALAKQIEQLVNRVIPTKRIPFAKHQHLLPPAKFTDEFGIEWFYGLVETHDFGAIWTHYIRSIKGDKFFTLQPVTKAIELYYEIPHAVDIKLATYKAVCHDVGNAWRTMTELLVKAEKEHPAEIDFDSPAPITIDPSTINNTTQNTPVADPADGHLPIDDQHPMLKEWHTWIESDPGRAALEHIQTPETQRAALYLAWSESWRKQQQNLK